MTAERTRRKAATYWPGLLPLTRPDQACHGVLGSGIGRKIAGFLSAFSWVPRARRLRSYLPVVIFVSRNFGWTGLSTPPSGAQVTTSVRLRRFAIWMIFGFISVPPVTYVAIVLTPGFTFCRAPNVLSGLS